MAKKKNPSKASKARAARRKLDELKNASDQDDQVDKTPNDFWNDGLDDAPPELTEEASPKLLPTDFKAGEITYSIDLTDWQCRELRRRFKFDLYDFFTSDDSLVIFFERRPELGDILAFLVGQYDDESKLEAFCKTLNGSAIEAGRRALENAVINFSPAPTRLGVWRQFRSMGLIMLAHLSEVAKSSDQSTE